MLQFNVENVLAETTVTLLPVIIANQLFDLPPLPNEEEAVAGLKSKMLKFENISGGLIMEIVLNYISAMTLSDIEETQELFRQIEFLISNNKKGDIQGLINKKLEFFLLKAKHPESNRNQIRQRQRTSVSEIDPNKVFLFRKLFENQKLIQEAKKDS